MLDFTTNKANAAVPPKLGWISIVNSQTRCFLLAIAACISLGNTLSAQQEAKMPVESDYYKIVSFEIP
jgi:hypothetical protein